ncbi:MAG: DUF2505 family protein [Polyangiaceae bacterium]|nr:DUF2505 family protein [Polyangiaceae bacterium]
MPTFRVTHEINCNIETFWKIFFDKEFNEKLYREGLGFPEFNVVDQKETDKEITRKCAGKPKLDMPGPVMKLLGDSFRYTEEGKFDKSTQVWRWKMTPSSLADKLRQEGTLKVEAIGDNKVRRTAELINEAKVFGIGGMLESSAEKSLRDGWDKSAVYMNKWIASKPAT